MRHEFTVVRVRLTDRTVREMRVVGLVKLQTDEEGHPYGQWSVVVDLWSRPDELGQTLASLRFASSSAPTCDLKVGQRFELRAGPHLLGEVEVLTPVPLRLGLLDQDFLKTRNTQMRQSKIVDTLLTLNRDVK